MQYIFSLVRPKKLCCKVLTNEISGAIFFFSTLTRSHFEFEIVLVSPACIITLKKYLEVKIPRETLSKQVTNNENKWNIKMSKCEI